MHTAIRPATADDMAAILADVRQADVDEMAALGTTPEAAMRSGLRISNWVATGLVDDVPVCMFGVAPANALGGIGAPWMLSANGLTKARRPFIEACRPVIAEMLRDYPRLCNVVDVRNTVAIRWLKWLGFEFNVSPAPLNGQLFLIFQAGDWHV